MATVKNTIALNDKVTPTLRAIIKSLNRTIDVLASVDNISDKAFDGLKRDVQAASTAIDNLNLDVQDLERPVRNATSGFSSWQAAIVTANQALQLVRSGAQAVMKITAFSDQQTGITSRLALMTGSLEEAKALQDEITAAANRSRASYTATADSVAQMGMMAADAFRDINGNLNTKELVAFTEAINKQLVISGAAGSAGADAALYQLTQAMSSGTLRGDELRSVMEQAPVIADTIAKYLGVTKGQMREMATEGQITADVVKQAMLSSLGQTNEQFDSMPTTFGQAMTLLKNKALEESRPLTERISNFINSDAFQSAFEGVMRLLPPIMDYINRLIDRLSVLTTSSGAAQLASDFGMLFGILGSILELVVNIAVIFIDNWQWISPIVYGVVAAILALKVAHTIAAIATGIHAASEAGATGVKALLIGATMGLTGATYAQASAQYASNAALLASPITWIIIAIIALIAILFAVVGIINKVTGSSISAIGIIVGALAVAAAAIWNTILMLIDFILAGVNYIWDYIGTFVNFFANVFKDPIGSVIRLFGGFADTVLGLIESVARGIDKLIGTNLAEGVSNWRVGLEAKVSSWADKYGNGTYEQVMGKGNLSAESLGLKRWDYNDAWDTGYNWGTDAQASLEDTFSAFDLNGLTSQAEDIAKQQEELTGLAGGNGGGIQVQGEVSITDEDIKMLKDVAAVDWVNKFTTLKPEMTVTFGDVHETADAEQLLSAIETMVEEAYASALIGG